jgi:hypothetical protein
MPSVRFAMHSASAVRNHATGNTGAKANDQNQTEAIACFQR